jgi:hypothetical protein
MTSLLDSCWLADAVLPAVLDLGASATFGKRLVPLLLHLYVSSKHVLCIAFARALFKVVQDSCRYCGLQGLPDVGRDEHQNSRCCGEPAQQPQLHLPGRAHVYAVMQESRRRASAHVRDAHAAHMQTLPIVPKDTRVTLAGGSVRYCLDPPQPS